MNLNDVRYDDSLRRRLSDLTHSDEINWLYGFCSVFLKWVNVSLRSSDRNCLVNHSVDNLQYASQNCSHQHSWEQHLQFKLYVSTSNLVVAWKPPLELKMVNFRSSKLWIMPNLSITAGCKVYEICWFRNSFQLDSILVTVRPQKREYDRFIRRNEAMPKEFLVHSEGFVLTET